VKKENCFSPLWRGLRNWNSDRVRRATHVGPKWKMYKKLARELVAKGDWFFIALYSGMQIPLLDAIDYLAEIDDRESIPGLINLFARYTPGYKNNDEEKTYQHDGLIISAGWGPSDYIPEFLQTAAVKALLRLFTEEEAKKFVKESVLRGRSLRLNKETIRLLVNFAVDNEMNELAFVMLFWGLGLRAAFDHEFECFRRDSRHLSHDKLYGYEELVYGSYRLSPEASEKEQSLQTLIAEYNHSLGDPMAPVTRDHGNIGSILCRIIEEDLAGNDKERVRVLSLLDPKRWKKDREYYHVIKNFSQ
jgi:hypothetical protein